MIKRLLIMLVGCLIVFGGVFGMKWMGKQKMNEFFDNMPTQTVTVSATDVNLQNWPNMIEAVGTLKAVHGVDVTTEAAGIVDSIRFESGDRVDKGAILLTLDADTDRADLKTLEAQASLARTELERMRKLYEQGSISKAELDRAESEANQAVTRAQSQRARVAQKVIRAPFTGELGIRKVDPGEYISPGTPIVTLESLDPLYFDFNLPEQNVSRVQPGDKVRLRVEQYPDEIFEGVIQASGTRVDSKTRNFQVRAKVPNKDGLLRPGVFARVVIELPASEEVLVVPRTAINYDPYGASVFVVVEKEASGDGEGKPSADKSADEDNEAPPQLVVRQRFVKTGAARGDFVVVLEGLKAGERIATSGLLKLRNDQPVNINNDVAPDVSLNPEPADT